MNYKSDVEAVDALAAAYKNLKSEIGKVIIGQDDVVRSVLISLFSNGHSLLVGVPGLAKTLLVSSIAEVLDLRYRRIQFTPDLMPADITGTEVLEDGLRTQDVSRESPDHAVPVNPLAAKRVFPRLAG